MISDHWIIDDMEENVKKEKKISTDKMIRMIRNEMKL